MAVLHCEHTSTSRLVLAIVNMKLFIYETMHLTSDNLKLQQKKQEQILYQAECRD